MFVSVVVVVRDAAPRLGAELGALVAVLGPLAADFEVVVVDNASRDESVEVLRELAGDNGLPNLQIFALANEVDPDTAVWVGLDSALGDFVAVLDLGRDAPEALAPMLDRAVLGADIVSGRNRVVAREGWLRRGLGVVFGVLYFMFHGVRFVGDTPSFRVLSRSAVNLIVRQPAPSFSTRQLGQLAGFVRAEVEYSAPAGPVTRRSLATSVDRGLRLLVFSTRAPLRSVTWLATLAASLNLLYSAYVIGVYVFKADVAPGWTTLSLQTSGMFLLISLILLILGEYVLQLSASVRSGPTWHVAREFTSATMHRRGRLNVVDTPGGA